MNGFPSTTSTTATAATTTTTTSTTPTTITKTNNDDIIVRMIELVSTDLTVDGKRMNIQPLLKLMDLCTCACAERHTGVNCVTVSMGDVVFETYPQVGDLLELVARPVLAGRTSLDVILTVTLERCGIIGTESRKEIVCEASFVYVTTRGPNGEKRLVPPLPKDCQFEQELFEWETHIAEHRRNLLKFEKKGSDIEGNFDSSSSDKKDRTTPSYDLESREVVLPHTQNHMDNTFGGQVMSWMSKAALIVASRRSGWCYNTLAIRSIHRVDFSTGSKTSDHLIFRTRLNAVFDDGRSAEIEVRVSKQRIDSGEETHMNTGYFFISDSASVSDIGTTSGVPFKNVSIDVQDEIFQQAVWRRTSLLARRQLLGGIGDPITWNSSLREDVTTLTIKSLLRMVNYNNDRRMAKEYVLPLDPSWKVVQSLKWARGMALGIRDSFIIEVKAKVTGYSTVESLVTTLLDQRPEWDNFCLDVERLEKESDETSSFPYDVVLHRARSPKNEFGLDDNIPDVLQYCLLRTWKIYSKSAIVASQSVLHDAVTSIGGRVLPSGWILRQQDDGKISIKYMAQHTFGPLRMASSGLDDEDIVGIMGHVAGKFVENLQSVLQN